MFKKDSIEIMLKKANKRLEEKNYIEAKNIYLKCLAIEPDNLNALNNLAQLYGLLGDDIKAKGYNELLLEECNKQLQHQKNRTLLMLKTNALISLKRNEELNETLDELLKIEPKNIIGLFQKAHYLEITNQNEKAIEYLDRILDDDPYNIAGLLSKGRNLVRLDEFEKAEDCYNLVLKIETKNITAIGLKSEMLKKKHDTTITPHDLMQKAIYCWEMKDFETSAEFFKKAINLNPNYDEIWFAQGELFIRMGKITNAINSFEEAFKLNPNSGGIVKHEEFFKLLNRMKWINTVLGYEK
ncbi:lipopolysaccharide assembly protein LapB [Methanobrevibacter sp.]|uniref:tetratricopeptide repeat protein n=1 Tax=Methanobrevibacter sp. TaxID=66852 RepID=UPI0025D07E71|nr:tetratricopeptide repeat protein [Methanobrevibacter sp.]MBR4447983.1 tetratricopeptide repeat protein [Methanobrevibacter sp.]